MYLVVSIFLRLAAHLPVNGLLSCYPFLQVDTWLTLLSLIVVDCKITSTAMRHNLSLFCSTTVTSYLGYLEAGKEYFNFAWLALRGKSFYSSLFNLSPSSCIQLCVIAAAGGNVYESITVISE
jgi:hypothetical protein